MKRQLAALVLAAGAAPAVGLTTAQELRPLFIQRRWQEAAQEQEEQQQQFAEDVGATANPMSALQEKPVEVGADGFPQLPEVSTMLGTAEQTLQGLTEQAASLEQRAKQAQKEKARKMTEQKVAYEGKLRAAELANRALAAQNKGISHQNQVLRSGNDAIRVHAQQLEATNMVMRQEFLALQSRLGSAQDFLGQSLARTDDSRATELRVLRTPAAKPETQETKVPMQPLSTAPLPNTIVEAHAVKAEQHAAVARTSAVANSKAGTKEGEDSEDDDGAADEDEGDDATSFIAVGSAIRREEPGPTKAETDGRELVKVLQKGIASLGEQEQASEAQLKALFDSSSEAGAKKQRKLLAKQESLNSTRASLTALQGELRAAEAHLEATQKQLSAKLHDTGAFLQKLAHLALAPISQVPDLTKQLPVSVSPPTSAPSVAALQIDAADLGEADA